MTTVADDTLDHVAEFVRFAHEMGMRAVIAPDVVKGTGLHYSTATRSLNELARQGRLEQVDRYHGFRLLPTDSEQEKEKQ